MPPLGDVYRMALVGSVSLEVWVEAIASYVHTVAGREADGGATDKSGVTASILLLFWAADSNLVV